MEALIIAIAQLAAHGITVYQQMHDNATSKNTDAVLALIPLAADIYNAINFAKTTLATAQAEGWTDDDPRWAPVFAAADADLAKASARLTPDPASSMGAPAPVTAPAAFSGP